MGRRLEDNEGLSALREITIFIEHRDTEAQRIIISYLKIQRLKKTPCLCVSVFNNKESFEKMSDFSLWIRKKGVTLQIKNTEYDNIQL